MKITIVGAGNIGTQFAVHAAQKGHAVIVYGSKPEKVSKYLNIVDENGVEKYRGMILRATKDAKQAFEDTDVIFVTVPAYCMQETADQIFPYIKKEMKIGLVPGTGGGECAFKMCAERGAVIFGFQRVPSVARLLEYGKTVQATGYRDRLYIASIPNRQAFECAKMVSEIFDMPCGVLPNYLNVTLTPSNPILHTTRLKSLFGNYKTGIIYHDVPLFYEDWDYASSELLLDCDEEVQKICRAFRQFDLSYVKSLKVHYESFTAQEMTKKISGIPGFAGLKSPLVRVEGGYIPDLSSRYFRADFSYGLAILVQIAEFADVAVPNMEKILEWYYDMIGKKEGFCFSDYGIYTKSQLIDFYNR